VLPAGLGGAAVVTFHDLGFYRVPEAFRPWQRRYLQSAARAAARRADRVIAVSESTRRDLVEVLGVSEGAIDVVPNGVDERFRPEADRAMLERFRSERRLPERFILYLGTLEPRKNLPNLLRAYAIARSRGVTAPLVIAGGPGWGDLSLARLIDELDLRSAVRPVGYVPAEEQPRWYAAATLFAYPSRYEGFGLPALEAMACGTPVVASDRSSLPEVVGDAGLLVDPDAPELLAAALADVLHDDELAGELARRGVARASNFRWDVAARETVETYRRALVAPRAIRANARDWPARQTVE
jgi:glycosyltransferase involved in cell wall biosynthesis